MKILKVFGPPGTGKTYKLLQIMEEELSRGVSPDRLAYLSFTVQARKEALHRAMAKFNLTEDDLPNFRTLHAICYRELNMTVGGMVKGARDLKQLGERLGLAFTVRERHADDLMLDVPVGGEIGDRLLQIDHVRRHNLQSVDEAWRGRFDDDLDVYKVRRFVDAYRSWKHAEGLRDFTDLLEEADEPLDVEVVIVDEAQDLSRLQWAALHKLAANCARMYIAGDDDQAIFTWAGADPSAFIDHPGSIEVLGQSFRIPASIHKLADRLSQRIQIRQPKAWKPRAEEGLVRLASDISRTQIDPDASYLMLYRHHYLVDTVEELVRNKGLPYTRGDRPAPGAEWGKAIIAWERLRKGREVSWYEVRAAIDGMSKGHGISETGRRSFSTQSKKETFTLAQLTASFGVSTSLPWMEALDRIMPADRQYLRTIISKSGAKALTQVPKIRLSTIHAAKGAEADHVILLTEMSTRTREIYEREPDLERRVFYVGVTRARTSLTLVGTNNPLFT